MYYDGVMDIVTSSEYTWSEIFPKCSVTSQNAKMMTFNINEYKPFQSLMCASRGSEMAGKVRCNRFLMVDDLIGKQEEAMNKNTLEKIWNNDYTTDARQRKVDGCKEIHIATRWSIYDVIGHLEQAYGDNPRAKFIAVPDIDEKTGESNFAYKYHGFSKEFFNAQELIMNDITYQCLYRNQPIEREGLLYNADMLRYFFALPDREPDAILSVCDTKSKGEDFMVLPVLYQYDDDFYLADCICDDSSDFDLQYSKITKILLKHDVQQCEIESNAGGDRLAFEVEKRVKENEGRTHITTKATETNKETRILVNSDWIIKHVLLLDKECYNKKSDYGRFM
jgi:predicted phage terminase large subunit-like protein